ncbi:SGNH/GDSL hydrolase family protein [Paenibacillus eucommiae]|uniref:Hydrolase n=1 Tax=Paenibacillus eucommiae TaxID=1355755 RepID=A0ABS4ILF9_9BACL|nr:SGNH/GDSL hydrolase family protein [Paenibacillus eucommiae]MBP1988417.1 hypothetical protein [Paenibacillus eucommiae]
MPEEKKALRIDELDANMSLELPQTGDTKWLSPLHAPFHIAGLAWFEEEGVYRRLPKSPAHKISNAVEELANCTAGGQIRFQTNSAVLKIRVKLQGAANMYHMPATGQCGFDCYIESEGKWLYYSTTTYDHTKTEYESVFFDALEKQNRNIIINFPLYQGVLDVEIGVEPNAEVIAPIPYKHAGRAIFYGTSITQGGCACRPGMAYTNILSRKFPLEFINLGFSGSGLGEPELAEIIATIPDPACLVLDYEANCLNAERMGITLPEFINIYRRVHPEVPILVLSKIKYAREQFFEEAMKARLAMKQVQEETVAQRQRQGDRNIYFYDGSELLGEDFEECTVDGVHPTDLGFLRMAEGLTPVMAQVLGINQA